MSGDPIYNEKWHEAMDKEDAIARKGGVLCGVLAPEPWYAALIESATGLTREQQIAEFHRRIDAIAARPRPEIR